MSDLFEGADSLRRAYDRVDWAATPLGAPSKWSAALRGAVDLALNTRFPVTLIWGPDFTMVYNAAYAPMIADKHPAALGASARDVFPEIWDIIGPMLQGVMDGHGATWVEDSRLLLLRRGFLEECYFTFSYSPVSGADGTVEGVIDIAAETTQQVIDRRRLELLSHLGEQLIDLRHPREVLERALPVLRAATRDLPAVDLVLPGEPVGTGDARLRSGASATAAARDLVVEETPEGRVARMRLDGKSAASREAVLVTLLSEHLLADETYLGFLRLITAALAQALDGIYARAAVGRTVAAERDMSETLQRSLLTAPLQPDHLQVAVRYQPAVEQAQIGGDWYDSFLLPDGCLTLVVGDVSGHDRYAAAGMAQARNLLRGVCYTLQRPPARVLSGLDDAMHGLAVNVFASTVLAQFEQDSGAGVRTLRWSNAGHPPPVLISRDGRARLLETEPDVMLGVSAGARRTDHSVTVDPGGSVVFYTDGLVERRDTPLEDGMSELTAFLTGRQDLSAEQLCDHLLENFGHNAEDDVVLLVVHAYAENEPRPPQAGSQVLPTDLRADF